MSEVITLNDMVFKAPYKDVVRGLNADEYARTKANIEQRGIMVPVLVDELNNVIDGHHRLKIASELGIFPPIEIRAGLTDEEKRGLALELNIHRRHLDREERETLTVKLKQQGKSNTAIAKELGVDEWTVRNDLKKAVSGNPETQIPSHVTGKDGKSYPATKPRKPIRIDTPEESEKIEQVKQSEHAEELFETGNINKTYRSYQRDQRKTEVAQTQPIGGTYRIIYADPPWNYGNAGLDEYGHAERHYSTMTIDELCSLKDASGRSVKDITQDNAVLFLWVTSPMLEDCFRIIRAWGFQYKASFVWDKVKHNFGYYNSVRHEFLLVCTRGSCVPDVNKLFDSVQEVERTKEHSEKPEEFRNIIDTLYPHGSRIELFRRGAAIGNWTVWGDQAE